MVVRLLIAVSIATIAGGCTSGSIVASAAAGSSLSDPMTSSPTTSTSPTPSFESAAPTNTTQPVQIGPVFWYDIAAKTDDQSALVGYLLTSGQLGSKPNDPLELPTSAWASGPVGGLVLVGSDDGKQSTVQIVGPSSAAILWTSKDIVWRGALLPDGSAILALLTRDKREEGGIVHVGSDGVPVQVVKRTVPPTFGQTWSEELFISAASDVLAVQDCAPGSCRSRFYDMTRAYALIGSSEGDFCQLIGVTSNRFAAFGADACDSGRPADVLVGPLGKGAPTVVGNGDTATFFRDGETTRLAIGGETPTGYLLKAVSLDGIDTVTIPAPAGMSLVAQAEANGSNYSLPDGWIALAPGGQLTPDGLGASIVNPSTGVAIDSGSVAP